MKSRRASGTRGETRQRGAGPLAASPLARVARFTRPNGELARRLKLYKTFRFHSNRRRILPV